jgi:hypothetical protein
MPIRGKAEQNRTNKKQETGDGYALLPSRRGRKLVGRQAGGEIDA